MCGIFGYIGEHQPSPMLLRRIAYLAGTRGCHANGVAWIEEGKIYSRKRIGKIDENTIFNGISTTAIIGHCRLLTSGANTLANAQPIITNGAAIAHNGNVPKYRDIAIEKGISLSTDNDSEVFLHLICRNGYDGNFSDYVSGSPYACLLLTSNVFVADRNKMPLYVSSRSEGLYFCSRAFDGAEELKQKIVIPLLRHP